MQEKNWFAKIAEKAGGNTPRQQEARIASATTALASA